MQAFSHFFLHLSKIKIMRKAIYFIFNIFLIIGCKKELSPQESTIDFSKVPGTNQPTNNNQQTTTTTNLAPNNTTVTKVNPPHGQPGHICGTETQQQNIPVQSQTTNNQQFTVSQPIKTTNNQTPTKVAKGMNPPHGQPGHRCDIVVGAPLNSKPNKSATTTNTTTNNTNTPALVSPNPTTTQVAPGMNPPHGQPGHVCGTPVGSPLNQETKTEDNKTTEEAKPTDIKKDN